MAQFSMASCNVMKAELEHRLFTQSKSPTDYKKGARQIVSAMKTRKGSFCVQDYLAPVVSDPAPTLVLGSPVATTPTTALTSSSRAEHRGNSSDRGDRADDGEEEELQAQEAEVVATDGGGAATTAEHATAVGVDGASAVGSGVAESPTQSVLEACGKKGLNMIDRSERKQTTAVILAPETPEQPSVSAVDTPSRAVPPGLAAPSSQPEAAAAAVITAASHTGLKSPQQHSGELLSKEEASSRVLKALQPFYKSGSLTKDKFKTAARTITHKLVGKEKDEAASILAGVVNKFASKFES